MRNGGWSGFLSEWIGRGTVDPATGSSEQRRTVIGLGLRDALERRRFKTTVLKDHPAGTHSRIRSDFLFSSGRNRPRPGTLIQQGRGVVVASTSHVRLREWSTDQSSMDQMLGHDNGKPVDNREHKPHPALERR